MVQTTARPVLTVLRTVRITMAAARASRPLVGSSCIVNVMSEGAHAFQVQLHDCETVQLRSIC